MALEMWETVKESITAYTGLSPATFFTVVALGLVTYYMLSGLFGSSSSDHGHHQRSRDFEEMEPLPPPVQLGEISEEELKAYDGSDPKKPLLMAIKGQIYDVSQSRVFYGPGGPYALFAGKDASRALAKMSFEEKDLTGDISGLGLFEMEALQDWEYKFMSKYVKVGTVKTSVPVSEATTNGEPSNAADSEAKTNGEPSQTDDSEVSKPAEAVEHDVAKPAEAVEHDTAKPAEAAEHDAAKPAEINEPDVAKPVEAIDHDDAKLAEGSPSETDNVESTSVVDADKKD